ncbi:hypothetical protein [Burkholderia cepacia]|uniref:hypothetical protein n=1 Tax=Burkholderia cepacia TaxID=292 RepID=UPI0012D8CA77|nr:hypothetical protein [Burkholderia cepacia]
MKFRKSELAQIQLDEAIRQFLDRKDYVCACTLAGAAEEIFGALLKREGIKTALDELADMWNASDLPALDRQAIGRSLNHVRNQLKHAGDPDFDEIEATQMDAMLLIARAAGMHPKFADRPTEQLLRFRQWWQDEAAALVEQFPRLEDFAS